MRKIYTNFADAAAALGIKVKRKAVNEPSMTCPDCGNEMRNVPGTNVWFCDWATLADEKINDCEVQVFTACGNRVLAAN
jgi:hypothetical protein